MYMYQQNQRWEWSVTHITKRHREEDSVIKTSISIWGQKSTFYEKMLHETDQLNDIMLYR